MIKKLVQRYAPSSKELIPGFRKTLPIFRFYQIIVIIVFLYMLISTQFCDILMESCPSVP